MNLIDRDKLIADIKSLGYEKNIKNLIVKVIEEQPTVKEWIPVERELPEEDCRVNVVVKLDDVICNGDNYEIAEKYSINGLYYTVAKFNQYFGGRNNYFRATEEFYRFRSDDVIAWKPIEPYTGDKE